MKEQERRRYLALQAFLLEIEAMTRELLQEYWPELYQSEQEESENEDIEDPTS